MKRLLVALWCLGCVGANAQEDGGAVYRALIEAARGGSAQGVCRVAEAAKVEAHWARRIRTACALLRMRDAQALQPAGLADGPEAVLVQRWLAAHPAPARSSPWVPALLSLVPGLGHLYLGRGRDALVAALLVWPMLALTLWAWIRRMGPVVVFFGGITAWLWSGVIFSAYALAMRGNLEDYLAWWRALWQASGLPGTPW